MKNLGFYLVLLASMAVGSLSHALSIDPRSVHSVVDGKIYRAGVTGGGYGTPIDNFDYACANGFTMVVNAYGNFNARQATCGNGRTIKYVGAHWQKANRDEVAATEIRQGGKVLVHCRYGVDASNFVAWIAAARSGLMSAREASVGFANSKKGSLGPKTYAEMAAAIARRGQ